MIVGEKLTKTIIPNKKKERLNQPGVIINTPKGTHPPFPRVFNWNPA